MCQDTAISLKPRIQCCRVAALKKPSTLNAAGCTHRRLISRIKWNPEQPHFIYRQERYTNKPPFDSTVALLPLHCARSRLKSMLVPWGHVRITISSELQYQQRLDQVTTQTSYRYTNTFSKVNEFVLALYNAIPAALSYFCLSAISVNLNKFTLLSECSQNSLIVY